MKLPVLASLEGYQRSWLTPDILTGITLAAIAIPEQMATAQLAGMPVQTGLYAFIAGTLMIAVLGSSAHLSVGADSTIAPVFAAGIAGLAAFGSPEYAGLVTLLAVVVGLLIMAVGIGRLGAIADFISVPVVTGFLAGVAVTIMVNQLPAVLGIEPSNGDTISKIFNAVEHLDQADAWTMCIAAGTLLIIIVAEQISPRIPGALVALVGSIVLMTAVDLGADGVAVIGTVPAGLPPLGLPPMDLSSIGRVVPIALTVLLVAVTQTAATTRSFATLVHHKTDLNRDLVGTGAGSVLAGLLGSFPVNSSPPRTAAVVSSGGRSQGTGLVAVVLVAGVALFATGPLANLPQATLGAILIYVATRIVRLRDLRSIRTYRTVEFVLALFTLVAVAVLGVEQGVLVAVVLAIAERTYRSARPAAYPMGRIPDTDTWYPRAVDRRTEPVTGVLVYLLDAPLWFANASWFRDNLLDAVHDSDPPVQLVVIDAASMETIDYTGTRVLRELLDHFDRHGIQLAVARGVGEISADLERAKILPRLAGQQVYPTVQEAVARHHPGVDDDGAHG